VVAEALAQKLGSVKVDLRVRAVLLLKSSSSIAPRSRGCNWLTRRDVGATPDCSVRVRGRATGTTARSGTSPVSGGDQSSCRRATPARFLRRGQHYSTADHLTRVTRPEAPATHRILPTQRGFESPGDSTGCARRSTVGSQSRSPSQARGVNGRQAAVLCFAHSNALYGGLRATGDS
jgi:hypothetical protein